MPKCKHSKIPYALEDVASKPTRPWIKTNREKSRGDSCNDIPFDKAIHNKSRPFGTNKLKGDNSLGFPSALFSLIPTASLLRKPLATPQDRHCTFSRLQNPLVCLQSAELYLLNCP
jgi:hypothetical protein